jgi:hypothetical protein
MVRMRLARTATNNPMITSIRVNMIFAKGERCDRKPVFIGTTGITKFAAKVLLFGKDR